MFEKKTSSPPVAAGMSPLRPCLLASDLAACHSCLHRRGVMSCEQRHRGRQCLANRILHAWSHGLLHVAANRVVRAWSHGLLLLAVVGKKLGGKVVWPVGRQAALRRSGGE